MKALGIILILLGLGGIGVGIYGMTEVSSAEEKIATNTDHLEEMLPGMSEDFDFTDVETLVQIDRALKDQALAEYPDAAWNILMAMGDKEDGELMQTYGYPAGGGLLLVGIILLVLGGRKKPAAAQAATQA